jgi:pyruvate/2-oxoglutarate dehydrogenase complex dihydrolipoamide acyltransferase (E2) component
VRYEFRLPDLGEGVTEAEISSWSVAVGQQVREDDALVEVETDKTNVVIPSPVDGVVASLHASEGQRVLVGEVLISLEVSATSSEEVAEALPSRTGTESVAAPEGPLILPAARVAARKHGVDLAAVRGTGPGGAINEVDVLAAASADSAPQLEGATSGDRREPLRGVRRRISERLTQSHQEIPKVTVVEECDFTELARTRQEMSYVPFVVRAVVAGLKLFPDLNASLVGGEIIYHQRFDIGIAAQSPSGLLVPVIRAADTKSLDELDSEISGLAQRVRDERLAPEELRGGTFTVTLAGKLGGLFATPLVNLGEAAILGVHRIAPRPAVVEGEIAIRDMGMVSCSFDHRITDGTRAVGFLLQVIERLQQPSRE